MSNAYGKVNFDDVEDVAPKHGIEFGEARFVREQIGAERLGAALYRVKPGARTGFGHRHEAVEEFYVVLSGAGRMKIDDDVIDLRALDVVRVAPEAVREFEAGPDGMVLLAGGEHAEGDGELLPEWWPAGAAA